MATIANLKVDQGADFATTINLNNLDGTDFNLSGYTVKSQMAKSYASATKTDITAAITNAATGAIQLLDDPYLAFISDNQAKGVSSLPALTVHLTNETSLDLWEESDETIIHFTLDKLTTHLSNVDVASKAVTRWRYAGPVEVIPDLSISWNSRPSLVIAGEAFNGPKVEGAFNSGIDAANKAIAGLSDGGGERCDE